MGTRVFVERCLSLLLHLFAAALELPDLDGDPRGVRLAHDEWREVWEKLQARFGDRDAYWMVFDPFELPKPEPIYGTFSGDLADIWHDLKSGLLVAKTGKIADAIAVWRFSFESHWCPFHAAHVFRPPTRFVVRRALAAVIPREVLD